MVIFEFTDDLNSRGKKVWFVGTTECAGKDAEHETEIYEQLDAQWVGWA